MTRTRKILVIGAGVLWCLMVLWDPAPAHALPSHYTDGTTFQGPVNYGPPPLAPKWAGAPCDSDLLIDPPSLVFITEHAGTTDPTDGTEFASQVVQYVKHAPGEMAVDGTWLQGHNGILTLTWNIGTGVSGPLAFHCAPDATTTTTTSTTVAPTTTTQPATTSTAIGTAVTSVEPTTTTTPARQLPFTGGDTMPLVFAGAGLCSIGALLVRRTR